MGCGVIPRFYNRMCEAAVKLKVPIETYRVQEFGNLRASRRLICVFARLKVPANDVIFQIEVSPYNVGFSL